MNVKHDMSCVEFVIEVNYIHVDGDLELYKMGFIQTNVSTKICQKQK